MRARLLLSVAATTLSLSLSPVVAQAVVRDEAVRVAAKQRGGESAKEATVKHGKKHGGRKAAKRGARPGATQQGGKSEARGAEESKEPGAAEPAQKAGGQETGPAGAKNPNEAGQDRERAAAPQGQTRQEREPSQGPRPGHADGATPMEAERRAGPDEWRGEREGGFERQDRAPFDGRETGGGDAAPGGVRLSEPEESRVRGVIEQRSVQSLPRDVFNARIGAVAPPNVQLYPLPPQVFSIVPQYRGYGFIRVENQIAIVDPQSRRVVSVLGGGETYGRERPDGSYGGTRRDAFGPRQETGEYGSEWRRAAPGEEGQGRGRSARVTRFGAREAWALYRGLMRANASLRQVCLRVGDRVPQFVEVYPVPRRIAAEAPDAVRYDYFILNDEVVLLDPDSRVVVDIIQEPR